MKNGDREAIDILFDARSQVMSDCGFWGTMMRRWIRPSRLLRNAQKHLANHIGWQDIFGPDL